MTIYKICILNDYFIPSSTTLDNKEKGIIDGYTDPTHAGKYHFVHGENRFFPGGLVIKGTEEDREKAINKEVDITFKNLQEQILSNKNMSLTEKMVRSGLSVKKFRGELLEASRTFAAGSLGDIVFKFYKELKTYYEDILVNQFQLFSDVNPYILGITAIEVHINGKVKYFSFGTGKNKNLAILKSLNEFDVSQAVEVQYSFELAPGLMHLMDLTENNPNHDLFEKAHEITVIKGNNTYVTGKFVPKWNAKGVDLISAGFSANDQKLIKSMQLGSDV